MMEQLSGWLQGAVGQPHKRQRAPLLWNATGPTRLALSACCPPSAAPAASLHRLVARAAWPAPLPPPRWSPSPPLATAAEQQVGSRPPPLAAAVRARCRLVAHLPARPRAHHQARRVVLPDAQVLRAQLAVRSRPCRFAGAAAAAAVLAGVAAAASVAHRPDRSDRAGIAALASSSRSQGPGRRSPCA